jgi:broad specificity phosphatase PhoE
VPNKISGGTKRLFLARHGESVANQQKLISGQMDTPLTEKGRSQAQWLCEVLHNEKLSAIYTSSLSRTMETARPTADFHGINILPLDDLKEFHFGELQGKQLTNPDAQEQQQVRAADKGNANISGGETYSTFEQRITQTLEHILANLPDAALIVAHRNTNEVILANLLNWGATSGKPINIKNKYLYEIELGATPIINTIRLGGEFHGKKFAGLKDD